MFFVIKVLRPADFAFQVTDVLFIRFGLFNFSTGFCLSRQAWDESWQLLLEFGKFRRTYRSLKKVPENTSST